MQRDPAYRDVMRYPSPTTGQPVSTSFLVPYSREELVTGWHLMADLFLTHMLINPQIDRTKPSAQPEDPYFHLGRARETADGVVVRGAKMLGTIAPRTEEVAVIAFGGVAPGDDAYALA